MTTLTDLIEETIGHLHAWTEHAEQATTLVNSITAAGGITLQVTAASAINKGYVEIDSELIYVEAVDANTNLITVPTWGRAQQGSVAATHAANSRVSKSPRFPRARVKRTLNEVIAGLYPSLFVIKVDELSAVNTTRATYPLPTGAQRVRDISWQSSSVTTEWIPVQRWRLDMSADPTQYVSGLTVSILDGMEPGRTIKIVYEAVPSTLTNDADNFTTVSGLPDSASDLVCLGAACRLITGSELARTQPNSMEQAERSQFVPSGSSTSASKYLFGLYQQRVEQERNKLLALYPPRVVRTW